MSYLFVVIVWRDIIPVVLKWLQCAVSTVKSSAGVACYSCISNMSVTRYQGIQTCFRLPCGFILSLCGCYNEHSERTENFDVVVLRKLLLGRPRKRWNSINSKLGERECKLDRTG